MTAPAVVAETPATPVEEIDSFSAAFENLTTLVETPATETVTPPVTPAAETPETPAEETPEAVTVEGEPESAPASESAAADKPETRAPSDTSEKVLERLTELLEAQRQPAQPQQPAEEQVDEFPALAVSEEDRATIAKLGEEYPEVAAATAVQARIMAHSIVTHVFKELMPQIRQTQQAVQALYLADQESMLREDVPGYDTLDRKQVLDWIGKQPPYLRSAYMQVVERGVADDVSHMLKEFIAQNPNAVSAQKSPSTTVKTAVTPKVTEMPAPAKKAAAALAPVSSQRSAPATATDKSNFDAGWDQAAKTVN